MPAKQFTIKRNYWDSKARDLTLAPDYITYDDKSVGEDKATLILKDQVKEFRYGIVWLRGLRFYIGRQYNVYVKTNDDRELRIDFLTYYGIRKKELHTTFCTIVDSLFDLYSIDFAKDLLEKFDAGEAINVCGLRITGEGVSFESKGLLRTKVYEIPWPQVKTRFYQTYYAVYSSENAADINKSFKYLDDYNVDVLSCILETILKEKQEKKQ